MNGKTILALSAVIFASGCTTATYKISSTFNETEASRMLETGTNTIRGSALIRQRGGGVVTCAGKEVQLVPATSYAVERISAVFGNSTKGFNSAGLGGTRLKFENAQPVFKQYMKSAICDAQGFFRFEKIANGSFFVTTVIAWKTDPYFFQGGELMQQVTVNNGETKEIVLAP